jgi:hypothetical protein
VEADARVEVSLGWEALVGLEVTVALVGCPPALSRM